VPACFNDGITVDIGLTPNTDYTYILTTPYNKHYAGTITTDVDGKAILTFSEVPSELFNPWIRLFQLSFYAVLTSGSQPCSAQDFTICDVIYNNIAIKFIEATGLPAIIGCQCEEV
jgi:hypothetical protein